jgi:hypothetical protein
MSPTTELKSLKAEAKNLKTKNDAALLKLRTDNGALAKANGTLSTDLNAATEQRGQAVQANVVLNNTNVDLTSTNKTLETEATVLLKQVEDLTNAGKLLESRITEIEAGAGGDTGDLKRQIAELEKNMEELAVHYGNVSQDHALLSKSDLVWKQANKLLADKLQAALAELKKEGKSALFEQAKDIAEPLREHVRTEAYREWKFIHNETEVTTFMEECYAAMVKKLPNLGAAEHDDYLTMEDFDRIYRQVAVTKLNSRRQFSQTQMYKAVFSKCQFRSWRQKLLGYIH